MDAMSETSEMQRKDEWHYSLTPKPFLKKHHVKKDDLLLAFQKRRFRLDIKRKYRQNNHIEDDLISTFKNSHTNERYRQVYY
jgi:hypothetical protein